MPRSIPDSELVGAVQNIALSAKRPYSDGDFIEAVGIIPFNAKGEFLRPTFLACLRAMRLKYPHSESISIEFFPDKRMLDLPSYNAGRAIFSLGEKNILLRYGIPTDQQINKWNQVASKANTSPIFPGLKAPTMFRPDRKTFDKGLRVIITSWQITKEAQNRGISDEQNYLLVSKKLVISEKDVKSLDDFMYSYYSGDWGSERIILY
jgi:hypothetical protein